MRPRTLLAAFGILMVLGGPATGQVEPPEEEPPSDELPPIEEYEPTFTRADLWLHANGSPIGNLDAAEGRFLQWDENEPTGDQGAVYIGNNYNFLMAESEHDPVHFPTMDGTVAGDLDNIAFDLYLTGWAQSTLGCGISLSLELIVDDQVILSQDIEGSAGYNFEFVDDTTVKTRFVLTNLWEMTKLFELEYGPDVEHDVYLNILNFYACNEFQWRYDSAAYPSGLIVNHEQPSAAYFKVDVLDPPPPLESPARLAA